MKALSVNTRDKFLNCFCILVAVLVMVASCQSSDIQSAKRRPANSTQTLAFSVQPQCPERTERAAFTTTVDINRCLSNYVHDRTEHGVRRHLWCYDSHKSHERFLRNNMYPQKMFLDQNIRYELPTHDPEIRLQLVTNASFYYIQGIASDGTEVSADDMRQALQSVAGLHGAPLSLFRCECRLNQAELENSMNQCQQQLTSAPRDNTLHNATMVGGEEEDSLASPTSL